MHPGIFFGLALFFGIFLLAGHAARMFILFVVGLSGMAAFTLLTGITIPKRWNTANQSFQTNKNYPTWIVKGLVLLIGSGILLSAIYYFRDMLSYINKDFVIVSGVPSSIEEYDKAKAGTDLYLTIDGKTYELYPTPWYENLDELKHKKFTLYYLPKTKWLVRYEMEEPL